MSWLDDLFGNSGASYGNYDAEPDYAPSASGPSVDPYAEYGLQPPVATPGQYSEYGMAPQPPAAAPTPSAPAAPQAPMSLLRQQERASVEHHARARARGRGAARR